MTQSSHLPHFRTWLASLEEEELATILRNRPDVLNPLPPSIAALATRLLLRTSIARALMNCTARQLAEIEAIARRGGELEEVEDLNPDITRQLKERGLAYGNILIPPEVMPALPTGWSLLDQVQVSPEDIAELPDEERKVLETLSRSMAWAPRGMRPSMRIRPGRFRGSSPSSCSSAWTPPPSACLAPCTWRSTASPPPQSR